MQTPAPDSPSPSAFARRRLEFRRWRRGRPFWSGLLLILSGIELWFSSNLDLGALELHIGYEGFLSYLLPTIMVLTGLFVWFTPKQRIFYGVIGALTAIYSLIGLNLGGWFLGMLIGTIGGGLAFAWAPVAAAPAPPAPPESTVEEPEPATVRRPAPRHGRDDDDDPTPPSGGGGNAARFRYLNFRTTAVLTLPLLLLGGLVLVSVPSLASVNGLAAADPCAVAAVPTATPTATPTAAPTPPSLADLWRDFWDKVLGRGAPRPTVVPTAPPPSPTPTCTPTAPSTGPGGPGGPTGPGGPQTGGPGGGTGSGGGSGAGDPAASPSPTATPAPAPLIAAAPGQPIVSEHPARMTTSVLTLEGFGFAGIVELPTASGTIRTLEFTIDRATNEDFQLLVDGGQAIRSDPLIAAGSVKLYTSRFSGSLLGIPLTFTPDAPPPITLPFMIFTNVSLDLVFLDCHTLSSPTLTQTSLTDPSA